MRPRVLTVLACLPMLAGLAVLTFGTILAAPARPVADPMGTRLATGAGVLVGVALAIAILRRVTGPAKTAETTGRF